MLSITLHGPRVAPSWCDDCDRPLLRCWCEFVLRCSCGVPDAACVCRG